MRQVICAFVFDHLDAEYVTSGAFSDNLASLGVSRKVGYADNGWEPVKRMGKAESAQRTGGGGPGAVPPEGEPDRGGDEQGAKAGEP
jgi:hypothetical protein